jgi:nicotinamidase-related amidase
LSTEERSLIERGGYGKAVPPPPDSRAALLLIDIQGFLVERPAVGPSAVGRAAWEALPRAAALLGGFRAQELLVVHTRLLPPDSTGRGLYGGRIDRKVGQYSAADVEEAPEVRATPGEPVLDKSWASAFAGTRLDEILRLGEVDRLVVAGGTTSGCVRATVVDAARHGFSPVVASDAVFDRIAVSHHVSLLDLWMKYAEVLTTSEVLDQVMKG